MSDRCAEGVCKGIAYGCDDGLECTSEACDGAGGCIPSLIDGTCYIDNACVLAGEADPERQCHVCEHGSSYTAVSGVGCEDGDPCTLDDLCAAGSCLGGRSPDDRAAGDWLSFPATFDAEGHQQSVDALAADGQGGLLVQGSFIGTATFANGRILGAATTASYLAGYLPGGSISWLAATSGGAGMRILGRDVTRRKIVVSIDCTAACTLELDDGTQWPVPSAAGASDAIVRLERGLNPTAINVSDAPILIDSLDRTYAVVRIDELSREVTGSDGIAMTITKRSEHDHLAIVRYAASGVIDKVVEAYIDSESVGPADLTRLEIRALARKPSGGESPHLIFASSTDLWVIGTFIGRTVTFGTGTEVVEHSSTQYFSLTGPPARGAGGEAYVAKLTSELALDWVRFFEPGGAEQPGSTLRSAMPMTLGDVVVSATFRTRGSVLDADLDGDVLVRFDANGNLVWAAEVAPGIDGLVSLEPDQALYVGGKTSGGTVGIGAASTVIAELPKGVFAGFVERANSEGGFVCGASR